MNETTMNILISMSTYICEVGDFHIFIGVDKTALQKECTKSYSLQQLRKGQFPHTITSTRDSFFFCFRKGS